jgi:hypothetical protein
VTDTPQAVSDLFRRLLMQRPGDVRLRMGCDMFDAARALMRSSLGDPSGADSSPDLKARLFLRTYASDFNAETAARITARLRGAVNGLTSARSAPRRSRAGRAG